MNQPKPNKKFVTLLIILSIIFMTGVHTDGWAHRHIGGELDTFFSGWHAMMYGGYALVGILLSIFWIKGKVKGLGTKKALPLGYGLSLLGVVIFFIGGLSDLIWHEIFGIEESLEALLSPTHLILAIGAFFMVSGPLRYALLHKDRKLTWSALFSSSLTLTVFTFVGQYTHPMINPWAMKRFAPAANTFLIPSYEYATSDFFPQATNLGGTAFHTIILFGFFFFLLQHFKKIPFWSMTVMFSLNAAFIVGISEYYIFLPAATLTGFMADLMIQKRAQKGWGDLWWHYVGLVLPAIWMFWYFVAIFLVGGTWWSTHLWAGTIAMSAVVGLLLSYLIASPGTADKY